MMMVNKRSWFSMGVRKFIHWLISDFNISTTNYPQALCLFNHVPCPLLLLRPGAIYSGFTIRFNSGMALISILLIGDGKCKTETYFLA